MSTQPVSLAKNFIETARPKSSAANCTHHRKKEMTIDTATRVTVVPIALPTWQDEALIILVLLPADSVNAETRPSPTLERGNDWSGMGMTD